MGKEVWMWVCSYVMVSQGVLGKWDITADHGDERVRQSKNQRDYYFYN